jgi:alpha-tubulin suppressor-like RCC1 family protein
VIAISAGNAYTVALKSDGSVVAWGYNSNGQLGDGTSGTNRLTPVPVSGLFSWVSAIDAGGYHTVVLKNDGSVWTWGDNSNWQLGDPKDATPHSALVNLDAVAPIVSTDNGPGSYSGSVAVTLACSDDFSGCSGIWYTDNGDDPTTASTLYSGAISLTATTTLKFIAQDNAGNQSAIGGGLYNIYQASFPPLTVRVNGSGTIHSTSDKAASDINCSSGCSQSFDVGTVVKLAPTAASGSYFGNWSGCDSVTGNVCTVTMSTAKSVAANFVDFPVGKTIAIDAGTNYTIALKSDGTVWEWGVTLGSGTSKYPVQVSGLTGVISIAAASSHAVALKSDGTVWTWGVNSSGQLGNNTLIGSNSPVQVKDGPTTELTGITAIGAGSVSTIALKIDGTVWTWGGNVYGQLGTGDTSYRQYAVKVQGLSNVIAITAGGTFSTALKADGSVLAWGHNASGQLGDGTTTERLTPDKVGLTDVIAIDSGNNFTIALRSNGTVWGWGYNNVYQLGVGNISIPTPKQVNTPTNVTSIAAGVSHAMALRSDGTVWAWGANVAGQLGDNTSTPRSDPVQVEFSAPPPVIVDIAVGFEHSVALDADGKVWSWGSNTGGALGDGTTTQRLIPVSANQLAPCNVQLVSAISSTLSCYPTFIEAYSVAGGGDTMKLCSSINPENIDANRDINVTLQGGFDATFATATGTSSITGLTITSGSLDISGMAVQ